MKEKEKREMRKRERKRDRLTGEKEKWINGQKKIKKKVSEGERNDNQTD